MADILNLWRVDLRLLERSASSPGVTRKDMLVLLSGLSSMSASDLCRFTRLFTLVPKSQWVDVIRRQKGYDVPPDTPKDNRDISDSQARATATKRCPSCGTYCTHRFNIKLSTRHEGQWWCVECLKSHLKGVAYEP